jgi:hypothetical protein
VVTSPRRALHLFRPFRASDFFCHRDPGRCPGLACCRLSGGCISRTSDFGELSRAVSSVEPSEMTTKRKKPVKKLTPGHGCRTCGVLRRQLLDGRALECAFPIVPRAGPAAGWKTARQTQLTSSIFNYDGKFQKRQYEYGISFPDLHRFSKIGAVLFQILHRRSRNCALVPDFGRSVSRFCTVRFQILRAPRRGCPRQAMPATSNDNSVEPDRSRRSIDSW